MSADLSSDPKIQAAYSEIRNADSPVDWLYLTYAPDGPKDKLVIAAHGEAGLDGLKSSFASRQTSSIYFGLLRLEGRFLLFTLLPEDAGGVKRARALVHSRAVGAKFSHQASLTISRPEDLTASSVRSKLRLDSGSANSSLPPSPNPQLGSPSIMPGPSPLRSHFPGNSPTPSNGQSSPRQHQYQYNEAPPPIPAKEGANLSRAGTNASTYSTNLSPRVGNNQFQQEGSSASNTSPRMGSHPNVLPQRSASSASATSGLGLGMPVNGHHTQYQSRSHTPMQFVTSQNSTSVSPRLASLDFARKEQPSPPQDGMPVRTSFEKSPRLGSTSSKAGSRAPSPATSATSRGRASLDVEYSSRPQELPLPDPIGDTAPSSTRTLEDSTLASMLQPHDPDGSYDSIDSTSSSTAQQPGSTGYNAYQQDGHRESTDSDRQAAAEAVARQIERQWQAEQAELRQRDELEQRRKEDEESGRREAALRIQAEEARRAEEARLAREAEVLAKAKAAEEAAEGLRIAQEELAERQRQEEEQRRREEEEERSAEAERQRVQEEERKEREKIEAIEAAKREEERTKLRAKDDLRSRLTSGQSGKVALTGFVSVQGGASILWRRRYFEMTPSSLNLYKSDKDTSAPIDTVSLPKNVKSIESYAEELMAIPHSFKLVFRDYDEEPMLFYCDEADDKDLLISGLKVAAGL